MSTKKKIAISITTIALVLLLAIVAVVIVWASTKEKINGDLNISYTGGDVAATVTTKYKTEGGEFTVIKNGQNNDIQFTGQNNDQTAVALDKVTLELTKTSTYIIFETKFAPLPDAEEFSVNLTYTDTYTGDEADDKNMVMKYIYSATEKTNITKADFDTAQSLNEGTKTEVATVSGNSYVYVLVAVDQIYNDALCSGNFSWDLATE